MLCLSTFCYPTTDNPLVGKWQHPEEAGLTIELKADMSYEVDGDGDGIPDVKGAYEIEGQSLILSDKSGNNACKEAKGIYTFTIEAGDVSFVKKEDNCPSREGVLDGVTWKKS